MCYHVAAVLMTGRPNGKNGEWVENLGISIYIMKRKTYAGIKIIIMESSKGSRVTKMKKTKAKDLI